jgi:hypothetical protein
MLTKSRWWLTKSSRGTGGLGDQAVENNDDTCQDFKGGVADTLLQGVLRFGPQNHRWTVSQVRASKSG